MGELFLARMRTNESGFERLVVIKRILPHLTDKDEFVNMFLDEARVAAQIHHPNVCQILELGQVEGRYYMALEYLEGVSMTQVIIGRKDYPELADQRLLISIMTQACEGLHFAHNVRTPDGALAGVVHRDVNPKNIFVTSAGVTKVLDFGIVKAKDALNVTRTGSVKGTYSYMSPEQIKALSCDRRSDVFSLGIVTWEALTGVRLFKRENDFHTWRAITEEDAPAPSEFRESIPPALDHAILKALSRDRERRFATAREFAVALEEAVGQGSLTPVAMASAIERAFDDELERQRARARIDESVDVSTDEWSDPPTVVDTSVTPSAQRLGLDPDSILESGPPLETGLITPPDPLSLTSPSQTAVGPVSGRRTGVVLAVFMILAIFTLAAVLFITRQKRAGADEAERPANPIAAKTEAPRASHGGVPPAPTPDAGVAVAADAWPSSGREAQIDAASDPLPVVDAAPAQVLDAAPVEPDAAPEKPDKDRDNDRARPKEYGTLTINARPYGTVFIDGRKIGITPIVKRRVLAGRHRIKVVSSVDNSTKSFGVKITADKETRRFVKW
jgi:serine/threonine-protein kinase